MSCYHTNVWCLIAESDKWVQVLLIHISHLLHTHHHKRLKSLLIIITHIDRMIVYNTAPVIMIRNN